MKRQSFEIGLNSVISFVFVAFFQPRILLYSARSEAFCNNDAFCNKLHFVMTIAAFCNNVHCVIKCAAFCNKSNLRIL